VTFMSGPKVVNIEARRRQLQRECEVRLRQLQGAVIDWRAAIKRAAKLNPAAEEAAEAMLQRLQGLRRKEEWETLDRDLAGREQFYRQEEAAIYQEIKDKARKLQERRHRVQISAATLARELTAHGKLSPPSLNRTLETALQATEAELTELEEHVMVAFREVAEIRSRSETDRVSERQREIARQFQSDDCSPQTLRQWVDARTGTGSQESSKTDRLSSLLAEVEVWASDAELGVFRNRATAISKEPDRDHRNLLIDSLILEVAEFRLQQQRKQTVVARLQKALAMLEPFHSEAADELRSRIHSAMLSTGTETAEHLGDTVEKWCGEEAKREDAQLRRRAVLNALSKLGYEVREGMITAWAEEGQIIVHKPTDTAYGVELMCPGNGSSLQARVVAVDDSSGATVRNPAKDKAVEDSWCREFSQIQEMITAAGFDSTVQHASPAGAVKLKVVPSFTSSASDRHRRAELLQPRTILKRSE
jgi:hypothetical protein